MRTARTQTATMRADTWAWGLVILLVNLGLVAGRPAAWAIFRPGAIASGEWWRLVTHPLAHASLYHLALDAGAFLTLYASLQRDRPWRLLCVLACGLGSLTAALATPAISDIGFCGLSGIAHGLLAVVGIEMLMEAQGRSQQKLVGATILALAVAKCVYECISGHVFFAASHVGNVGVPIVTCHAGGLVGAMLYWLTAGRQPSPTVTAAATQAGSTASVRRRSAVGWYHAPCESGSVPRQDPAW